MADPQAVAAALPLEPLDLLVASSLVLVAGVVSLALRLGLGARLLVASIRTVVQLLLVGLVLKWIFELDAPGPMLAVAAVMIGFAGRAAVQRVERSVARAIPMAILTLLLTSLSTTLVVTQLVIGVDPWFDPQYLIPILGMVLGNSLTGVSLCLDKLLDELDERRRLVEADLSLGASAWEAAREPVAGAVRRGMIPIINTMSVVGLVSLPGMMTGQILAGADPLDAVAYQIVVMFMLAAATALGCILIAWLVFRRVFDAKHRLRVERIHRR